MIVGGDLYSADGTRLLRLARPFAVEALDPDGRWRVHRFRRLSNARAFAKRETVRLRLGLRVVRIKPDLSTEEVRP